MADQNTYNKIEQDIVEIAAKYNLPLDKVETFLQPDRVIEVTLPIKIDEEIVNFKGYRAQHDNTLGPYKGGLRFHPEVTRDEVITLSLLMSLKTALIGVKFGGGKGGVVVDPKSLTAIQLEELAREYVRKIHHVLGHDIDIPAPDVNTNPQILDWMADEYVRLSKKHNPTHVDHKAYATFTGKGKHGLDGRNVATGFGGAVVLGKIAEKLKMKPREITVAVMGFGNVGYNFANFASEKGFQIVAVSDSQGGVIKQTNGELLPLDIPLVFECKQEKGTLAGCYCAGGVCDTRGGRMISNKSLLELPVDVLVPAALGGVINESNMQHIKAKIIIEMANNPITPYAYRFLEKKGVTIVPDVLANSGGVAASYLEWEQNIKNDTYKKADVLKRLTDIMEKAFENTWKVSTKNKTGLKEASYLTALQKLIK